MDSFEDDERTSQVVKDRLLVCLAECFGCSTSREGVRAKIHNEVEVLAPHAERWVVLKCVVRPDRNVRTQPVCPAENLYLER